MLNHFYTLLINRDGTDPVSTAYPGEEASEPTYRALALPAGLVTVRSHLFGVTPDRYMLAYRGQQLLRLVAASELAEFLVWHDTRVTYGEDDELFNAEVFRPTAVKLSGPTSATFGILGTPQAPDSTGIAHHQFEIDVLTTSTVRVSRSVPPMSNPVFEFTLTNGLSERLELRPSGYGFRLNSTAVSQHWLFDVINRPTRDLSEILTAVEGAGEAALDLLFGITREEPFYSFRNLWRSRRETAARLAAVVCALVWRTEERRTAGA